MKTVTVGAVRIARILLEYREKLAELHDVVDVEDALLDGARRGRVETVIGT
jgi:hypothetical protein